MPRKSPAKSPRKTRSTKAVSKAQTDPGTLDKLREWIVAGQSEQQIRSNIAKTWPDEKPEPLIVKALKRMADNAAVDFDFVYGWCFEATREVHRRALEGNDFATALRAIKQLYELAKVKD